MSDGQTAQINTAGPTQDFFSTHRAVIAKRKSEITDDRNGTNRKLSSLAPNTAVEAFTARRKPTGAAWLKFSGLSRSENDRCVTFSASITSSTQKDRSAKYS